MALKIGCRIEAWIVTGLLALGLLVAGCGGSDTPAGGGVDGGGEAGPVTDAASDSGVDGASGDSGAGDGATDVSVGDGATCRPPTGTCDAGCPAGSVCLEENGIILRELGCAPIPPGCDGSCTCMAVCFCPSGDCQATARGLACGGG